ncbi:hypothetical protein OKW35_003386 [Paraburkholderia sp. MM5477-R1]
MTLRMMSRWPGRSRLIPNTSRNVLRIAFRRSDVSRGMEVSVMKLAVGLRHGESACDAANIVPRRGAAGGNAMC